MRLFEESGMLKKGKTIVLAGHRNCGVSMLLMLCAWHTYLANLQTKCDLLAGRFGRFLPLRTKRDNDAG